MAGSASGSIPCRLCDIDADDLIQEMPSYGAKLVKPSPSLLPAVLAALAAAPAQATQPTAQGAPWLAAAIVFAALALAVPLSLYIWRDLQERRLRHLASDAGRQATERALLRTQMRYQSVLESVNEVIFRTDGDGRLSFLNGAWQTITGYPLADSLGHELTDFLHPDDHILARTRLQAVIHGTQAECQCELRLLTRSGEVRWVEAVGRRVADDLDEQPGLAGTLDDISARKVAELTLRNINQELEARVRLRTAELEASNRELEAFSYSVSHDLRAPLRAIDGFAQILQEELDERLDDDARNHLGRIRAATQRMSQLIDDLNELARLTRHPLKRETVDLSAMARQIIDELRAEEPQRTVEVDIAPRLTVNADRNLMHVVLDNLLRNAWKFTARREHAHIQVQAEREGEQRVFCVSDDGAGFDMAFAGNLFRPFHRLHPGNEFPGTGIGLATVQRIVQRHGGLIWAHGRPGEGARFYFTLGQ